MIRIGSLCLPDGAMLAPMAGATDLPFRLLAREKGSAFAETEMVSAKGFLCAPKDRRAVNDLLRVAPQEGPVALQLFGHEPEVVAEAARRLEGRGFAAIDLNMGCPAPKITGGGDGSALLKDLPLAGRVMAAARKATSLPLMVKTRAGWDAEHIIIEEFAKMAEAEGVDALTVHGRTRTQFYAGEADWRMVARAKAAARVPVIGNGDVANAETAVRRMRETGCDAVMIGRGALGNPWIFAQVRAALSGGEYPAPGAAERVDMALRHARMLSAFKGEQVAIREMRRHAAWYTKGVKGAVRARAGIQAAETIRMLEDALQLLRGISFKK